MKRTRRIHPALLLALSVLTLLAAGCNRNKAKEDSKESNVEMRHARYLDITEHEGWTEVEISDPWHKGKRLAKYLLVDSGQPIPGNMPEGIMVRTPLKNAMVASSVHISLLQELGAENAIGGVCDLSYINIPAIRAYASSGRIKDCGSSMNPTIESVIELQPDALLLSPYENSGSFGKIGKLGIPIIECADYMENGPLARAEWMKFYGRLFGCKEKADSLFSEVEKSYLSLKEKSAKSGKGLKTLVNTPISGIWYIPGGESTTGLIIKDSGADYPWSDDTTNGAMQLSMESVIDKALDADIWIFSYNSPTPLTLEQMKKENSRYAGFKAFREGNVWGCNTSRSKYFEEIPFHPDRLLRDIFIITHPGLTQDTTVYYKRLN